MSRIRDLRKFINRLRSGPSGLTPDDLHALGVVGLKVNLQWAFSAGKEGMPPKERVRRANALLRKANALCKAARIILSIRNQQAISQNLNGTLDALEEAVERTEERREAFLNAHPELQRRRIRRSAP